jgi:hypothetical protein
MRISSRYVRGIRLVTKAWIYRLSQHKFHDLVGNHFRFWSTNTHPNIQNFSLVVDYLGGKPAVIIETGSSAWGTDSTRLWDTYVTKFGGSLQSVDVSKAASQRLRFQLGRKTWLHVSDSVSFLKKYTGPKVDFVYLDSWDVDPNDPVSSAIHGLEEFKAIYSSLKIGSLVLVDDTPEFYSEEDFIKYPRCREFKDKYGVVPGKGAFILVKMKDFKGIEIISHSYSLLLRYS